MIYSVLITFSWVFFLMPHTFAAMITLVFALSIEVYAPKDGGGDDDDFWWAGELPSGLILLFDMCTHMYKYKYFIFYLTQGRGGTGAIPDISWLLQSS